MGTRKTTTAEKDAPDMLLTDDESEQTPVEEELALALGEIGETEVRVQVQKTLPKDEAGACSTYSAQEFSIERVRDDWGGGTYILYFRLPNGQLKTKRRISILARKTPPTPPDRTAEIIAALKDGGGKDNTALILQLMQAQQKSTADMMIAMMTAQAANKTAPMGVAEIVALITGISQLNKGGGNDSSAVDLLLKGVKLSKELSGGGDGEGPGILSQIAEVAGPLLQKLGERNNAPPTVQNPVQVQARALQRGPDVSTSPLAQTRNEVQETPLQTEASDKTSGADNGEIPEGENVNLDLLIWLRAQVKTLLQKAEGDRDPALWADVFLDDLPEGITADLVEQQLTDPDAMQKLAMLDRRIVTYEDWFLEFRNAVLERIAEARESRVREGRMQDVEEGDPVPVDLYKDPNAQPDEE